MAGHASQVASADTLEGKLFIVKYNRFNSGLFFFFFNLSLHEKMLIPLTHIIWIRMPKHFGTSDIFHMV